MTIYNNEDLKNILDNDFLSNPNVFKPGRRNDDAVDMCCITWCLDMYPPDTLKAIGTLRDWTPEEYRLAEEHVDRVMNYLPNWGKRGTMEAMDYAIGY